MKTQYTARLVLRAYRPEDLAAHHSLLQDEAAMRFLPELRTHTLAQSRANLEHAMAQAEEKARTETFFAVALRETGGYIGSAGYTEVEKTPAGKVVHVGYFYLPAHHGRGYATEALAAVLRYAFVEDGVCRANTGCFAENVASARVMEKCGMVRQAGQNTQALHEGVMKKRLAYVLLRHEWEAAQPPGKAPI